MGRDDGEGHGGGAVSAATTKVWCADPRCGHAKALHTARGCPLCACDGHIEEREWNPNFEAYAMAHGTSPAGMLDRDAERWPGAKMLGFVLWISKRQVDFAARYPEHVRDDSIVNYAAWERFLWSHEGQQVLELASDEAVARD